MDPDSRRVHVTVTDGRGRQVRNGGLARWLAVVAPARARGEVVVALVSDQHSRRLNRTYRSVDAPTDVLSFPAPRPRSPAPTREPPHLGDIVIATGLAKRQAREQGHSVTTEIRVLALHGLLHLLGYDHEAPRDRGRMARAEARLRRKGGLGEGLIGRARSAGPASSRPRRIRTGGGRSR